MNKKIEWGQFFTPKVIVDIVYKMIDTNKIEFDFICDTSGGNGDFVIDTFKEKFIYIDIDTKYYENVKSNFKLHKIWNKNSLLDLERNHICSLDNKLLIVGNPPYNNWTSFYKKNQKGESEIKNELVSRDMGISFLKLFNYLKADYVCVLHPLSYLIKKSNFNQLKEFKDNYILIDGMIISSNVFLDTSKNTPFPILIGLYKRSQKGMTYEDIKTFTFSVYNTNYKFSLNQFLYIEDIHTKYKDKNITGNYKHFSTLRDMNQLVINKGFLEKENNQSIRVKGQTALKVFKYLEYLKKWYSKNQNEFYFFGNLSPIINKEIWKKVNLLNGNEIIQNIDSFFRNELSKNNSILSLFGNRLIWNFTNIYPTSKYRFITKNNITNQNQILTSKTQTINENDFLEIQISYDKNIEDFYNKPSIYKLAFKNNKEENKYIFELSDIFYWGLIKGFINLEYLKKLITKVQSIKNTINDEYKISIRKRNQNNHMIIPLTFNEYEIVKPVLISEYIDNDFIEIKIKNKQKAVGIQPMLFLNLSAKNFYINNESIIGKNIQTKDVIQYVIDPKKFMNLFVNLVLVFANLSKEHNQDILRILNSILDYSINKEQNMCKN
ncbi:R.Pab1 family restriction endonuclease [Mycoplasmopsis felis]|uniref:R.Pab1 family restriction endonuclease n=1 Tax=Mycoplasmopsis felis TaxID=33923 RepID=UPI002AF6C3EA|nr:R.Pab1 family restriction endonuclease [Mycoplasmopsis felis]WQQ02524.1 R.Pab1 family restriction endonuclease [Mycoplasmopsis felis]WQQ07471.1 R.Pab1 family restriction endonuclease [Mycoplasmopsis felis]